MIQEEERQRKTVMLALASTVCAVVAVLAFMATPSYPADYTCPPAAKCLPPVLTVETLVGTFEKEMMSMTAFEDARWAVIVIALSLDLACAIKIMLLWAPKKEESFTQSSS
ncbi:hypothetical protein EBT31_08170 [bacterium]|nr:hypothetical protein [bacterium]NBX49765.1 hypothetical protein [bacterium]